MIKLSKMQAPAIAGVIREETPIKAITEIKNCLFSGAQMIDLHMSCLNDTSVESLKSIISSTLKNMMENNGGHIINVASIAGITGLVDRVDYSASKAALIGMCKALAMEVGAYNVLVNSVSPGAIERDGASWEHMTYIGKNGRAGKPKNIAETVLFLASQDYITGENIVVDGGRTLGVSHI